MPTSNQLHDNNNKCDDEKENENKKDKKDDENNVVLTGDQLAMLEDQREELADLRRQVVYLQVSSSVYVDKRVLRGFLLIWFWPSWEIVRVCRFQFISTPQLSAGLQTFWSFSYFALESFRIRFSFLRSLSLSWLKFSSLHNVYKLCDRSTEDNLMRPPKKNSEGARRRNLCAEEKNENI